MAIGVAVLGSGIFVREEHLPAVLDTPSLSLKAIYSRSLASATALVQNNSSLPSIDLYAEDAGPKKALEDLLNRKDIGAIIIALPITVQPEYIKRALSAGKHVLAEKPVAKDVSTAKELISWYQATSTTTLSIAENYRYLERFVYGAEKVRSLGHVLGFRLRLNTLVKPGSKYYETAWRKTPEYQGGFLLDGGIHFVAGMRLMLGSEARMERVSAFTSQLQDYLPPADTVDATVRLVNGSSGTVAISFGTTFTGAEWIVACEKGTVEVERGRVTVRREGQEAAVKEIPDQGSGVKAEVKAWAEGLVKGKPLILQSPEEALADLEVIEALLKSGEAKGEPIELKHQTKDEIKR